MNASIGAPGEFLQCVSTARGHSTDGHLSSACSRSSPRALVTMRSKATPAMTLALAFLLLVLTVPLLGGKLGRLEEIRLRWLWLAALAFALQVLIVTVVPEGDTSAHRAAHLVSYALVGACIAPQPAGGGLPMDDRARRPPQPDGDRGQRSRDAGVAQRPRDAPGSTRAPARSRTRTSWRTRGSRSWATCSRSPRAGPAPTCSRGRRSHGARRAAGPPCGHRLAARHRPSGDRRPLGALVGHRARRPRREAMTAHRVQERVPVERVQQAVGLGGDRGGARHVA